jgi:hypothetical protein
MTGEMIPLVVESSDTIADVKEKMLDINGIPVQDQVLFYGGEQLTNDLSTLADYDIEENSTLVYFIRQIRD